MPLNGAPAQEQLGADLRVRVSVAREPRDLCLLRCELVLRFDAALPDMFAGGQELAARALSERFHADREEQVVSHPQLIARIDAAALAAQPLPVKKMGTGKLWPERGAAQVIDCLAV